MEGGEGRKAFFSTSAGGSISSYGLPSKDIVGRTCAQQQKHSSWSEDIGGECCSCCEAQARTEGLVLSSRIPLAGARRATNSWLGIFASPPRSSAHNCGAAKSIEGNKRKKTTNPRRRYLCDIKLVDRQCIIGSIAAPSIASQHILRLNCRSPSVILSRAELYNSPDSSA